MLESEMPQSFVFKMPFNQQEHAGVDLKWLSEQSENTKELLQTHWENHTNQVEDLNIPPELLRAHLEVIHSLAEYQISLIEQQRRRYGFIQNESDLQEMMNNIENMLKTFKEQGK
ncbi:MAG: hypothetical protein SFT81_02255 [Candidatus Caenarcaniphilales bacterium]|nr:hypothetical protein [Candidatus Caenarcaniphilales bacterium]